MTRSLVDTTDPFASWAREKKAAPQLTYQPKQSHRSLTDRPPTHVRVNGKVAVVVRYLGEHLWLVKVQDDQVIVHELDTAFFSRDWTLYQG